MPNRTQLLPAMALLTAMSALVTACDAPASVTDGGTPVTYQSLVPTIDALEPDPAYPGDEVTLHGSFHKLRRDDGLFVSFNGYDSMHVTLESDHVLKAVVPEGASSGNVVVVIGDSVAKGRFLKIHEKKRP